MLAPATSLSHDEKAIAFFLSRFHCISSVWEGAMVKTPLIKFASESSFPWLHPLNHSQSLCYLWTLLKHNAANNDDEQQERKDEGGKQRMLLSCGSIQQLISHKFHESIVMVLVKLLPNSHKFLARFHFIYRIHFLNREDYKGVKKTKDHCCNK